MEIFSVVTEIRAIASNEGMTLRIVVRVVVIRRRWGAARRIGVGVIAAPCSILISEAEVTLVAEAVAIAIVSMVRRSAVVLAAADAVVVHMIVVVAVAVVGGGFPTPRAGDFTRIEI